MKKTILILIIGMVLLGVITAGVFTNFSSIKAKFDSNEIKPLIKEEGYLTFDCGRKSMSFYISENNMNFDDEIESGILYSLCDKEITNLCDWTGRCYEEVYLDGVIYRSFDEDKLNDKECKSNGKDYNKVSKECEDYPDLNYKGDIEI